MVALVAPLLAWTGLAASFVIALAAVVRMTGPVSGADGVTGVIRLPEHLVTVIGALFGLAVLVFVGDLVWRALSNIRRAAEDEPQEEPIRVPRWVRRLSLALSIVNVAVLIYLWRRTVLEGGFFAGLGALASGLALPAGETATAPAIFNWTFGILALAAGLGALGFAMWMALGDRLTREPAPETDDAVAPALEAAVEESLEDLRAEPDARRAIVRCYARFERVAADSGLARQPWLTPMEFMREALARLPVPRAAVPVLTGLFELARFSDHALGPRERDRALVALHEIRTAIEERPGVRAG